MTRVKICGLTNRDDALRAVQCGADAVGFVFAPRSRRCADPATVARIVEDLPQTITTVGVFQDQPVGTARDIMLSCRLDIAQLHGREDTAYMESLALPILKAVALRGPEDLRCLADYPNLGVFLLDTAVSDVSADGSRCIVTGGTGISFDWSWAAAARPFGRIVLSGGLRPDNVADAVRSARPWAVDTASGTECRPGRKDPEKLRSFVWMAKEAGAELQEEEEATGWGPIVRAGLAARPEAGPEAIGRLEGTLRARRSAGGRSACGRSACGKSFVPFFMGGYPDRDTFRALLLDAQQAGVEAIEVGIPAPYSPLDGPVIRRASRKALDGGSTPETILQDIAVARAGGLVVPIVLMAYSSVFLGPNGERLANRAHASGIEGLLIVDPARMEAGGSPTAPRQSRLEAVALITPTTSHHRYPAVLNRARGFVYCVSVQGGTGTAPASVATAREMVGRVRRRCDIPALVGFGITGPRDAQEVASVADGIVMGSALLRRMDDSRGSTAVGAAGRLLREVRRALDALA